MAATVQLVRLGDVAEHHVGRVDVALAATVQQISRGRRAAFGGGGGVRAFRVLQLAGTSRAFFKLTCWGDAPPALLVGDIALFSGVQVKAFRGSVEAHFASGTSRAQLLFRGDQFFATRDVRVTDVYATIEWFKRHRCEILFAHDGASQKGITDEAETRPRARAATDFDGVLLCEVDLHDSPRDWIVARLWDQHADARFVARLLAHRGVVELCGVAVSFDACSNRLLANTTPETQITLVDSTAAAEADVRAVEKSFGLDLRVTQREAVAASFEELESHAGAPSADGLVRVDTVRVERVRFGVHLGSSSRVEPQFVQRLVESYCSECDDAFPALDAAANPPIVLQDAHEQRLQLEVESDALLELAGN
ncbi:hypothetical protein PybrP1_011028, partial [[Pythium] brassicae (nom. inval.)]